MVLGYTTSGFTLPAPVLHESTLSVAMPAPPVTVAVRVTVSPGQTGFGVAVKVMSNSVASFISKVFVIVVGLHGQPDGIVKVIDSIPSVKPSK